MCLKNVLDKILRERHESTQRWEVDLVSGTVHQEIPFLTSNGKFFINNIFTGHFHMNELPWNKPI